MKPPKSNVKRELPDDGTHNLVCTEAIDFGTQPGSKQFPEPKRKIQLGYQLVDEKTSQGKAMMIYQQFTFSGSKKSNLMKTISAWFGLKNTDDFDVDDVLNKPGLGTIVQSETDGGTYANVTNISGIPKGTKIRKATEPVRSLYLNEDFDQETFDTLPEWMRNKIATSPEYAEIKAAQEKGKKKKVPAKKAKK